MTASGQKKRLLTMEASNEDIRWAQRSVEAMLLKLVRALAADAEATAARLRRWCR